MSTEHTADAAADHLEADLVGRPLSPMRRSLRMIASVVTTALSGDADPVGAAIDLVVTRRASGAEVLRVKAGSMEEADRLLQVVRQDLATKTVREFVAEWRHIDDEDGDGDGGDGVTSSRG
nr:hypothetical protein [Microbacterium lemovicicum]